MGIHVGCIRVELFGKNVNPLFFKLWWILMRGLLNHLFVELNSLFVVLFLGLKVSKIHVSIGKDAESFLNNLQSFFYTSLGPLKVTGLQAEGSELMSLERTDSLFLILDHLLEPRVSLDLTLVPE